MRRFISRKKILIPKYKLFLLKAFLTLIIFIILSFLLTKNIDLIKNYLTKNSFGTSNISNKNIYQNIFGTIPNSEETIYNYNNIEDLISNPKIYIYNTFQSTTYKKSNKKDYNISPIITECSLILSEYLKKEGINSLVELSSISNIKKEKNYSSNYQAMRDLIKERQLENPSLIYFFDLQISTDTYNETTYESSNKAYAKIKFKVGKNSTTYKSNLEFAKTLNSKLIALNKNLSRDISLEEDNLNEDLSNNILVIEIGGKENTIIEVNNTLKILAKIIKETLNENLKEIGESK